MTSNGPAGSASGLRLTIAGASHSGKNRPHNEDAWGFDLPHGVAAVADGMGGFERGEVASRTAIDALLASAVAGRPLDAAFREAHDKVRRLVKPESGEKVGSTAVAAAVAGGTLHVAWAGDSRAYLLRDGRLQRLTHDHSLVAELVRHGVITEADARTHPNRNVVTRGLGITIKDKARDEDPAETRSVPLEAGDRVLLCTDGLHGFLPEPAITEELAKAAIAEVPGRLVERTLAETEAGDNVTALVMVVEQLK
ncbi:MAG: PP2C family protein-serine/threonine phosphatase [Gammaproteobacteria bacterium]